MVSPNVFTLDRQHLYHRIDTDTEPRYGFMRNHLDIEVSLPAPDTTNLPPGSLVHRHSFLAYWEPIADNLE